MNLRSRVCAYMIALSFILLSIVGDYVNSYEFQWIWIVPILPIAIGVIVNLMNLSKENE